jgi:hypothetical protein
VFVACLTRKLFMYSTGRTPTLFDSPYLKDVAEAAAREKHTLVELIDALVHTPGFRSPAPLDAGE